VYPKTDLRGGGACPIPHLSIGAFKPFHEKKGYSGKTPARLKITPEMRLIFMTVSFRLSNFKATKLLGNANKPTSLRGDEKIIFLF